MDMGRRRQAFPNEAFTPGSPEKYESEDGTNPIGWFCDPDTTAGTGPGARLFI